MRHALYPKSPTSAALRAARQPEVTLDFGASASAARGFDHALVAHTRKLTIGGLGDKVHENTAEVVCHESAGVAPVQRGRGVAGRRRSGSGPG